MPNPPRKFRSKPSTKNLIRTLSKLGLCSRTQALVHVQAGRVTVNGRCVKEPGYVVRKTDVIQLNGETVRTQAKRYFLFHKPAGCVTTRSDEKGRKTVYDYLKGIPDWIAPVGRLDLDSEGLLVFTNDTDFAHRLTEPKFQVKRTYEVWVQGALGVEDTKKISVGMDIGQGERSQPARFRILASGEVSRGEIKLTEGKNREVRRIFEALGKPVTRLLRTAYGPFVLGSLPEGQWKEIFQSPDGHF
ncbi:MAG: rRNA pseudouridine synthase [Candidatus Omnitrophica bacterium]|nr:rRNA pseudouridine synthase [Candidatus Omnitrophota bacterium]